MQDCRRSPIAVHAPTGLARPCKASCLFFKVKWWPPYEQPKWDSWEPMRALTKFHALHAFLCSAAWQRFAASDAYKAFAARNKTKVPRTVSFDEAPRTIAS